MTTAEVEPGAELYPETPGSWAVLGSLSPNTRSPWWTEGSCAGRRNRNRGGGTALTAHLAYTAPHSGTGWVLLPWADHPMMVPYHIAPATCPWK